MLDFRKTVELAVKEAGEAGISHQEIMRDLATVMGCMVAAGSPIRATRLAYVKASMGVIAAVIDRDLN